MSEDKDTIIARLTTELEQMTAIKDIHQRKRAEYFDRAEGFEAKLAEMTSSRNFWRIGWHNLNADKGTFAQGIETAAKWAKEGYKCQTCGQKFLASDGHEVSECSSVYPSWERIELDELADAILDAQAPQAEPVREADVLRAENERLRAVLKVLTLHLQRMLMAQDGAPLNVTDFNQWVKDARAALADLTPKGDENDPPST